MNPWIFICFAYGLVALGIILFLLFSLKIRNSALKSLHEEGFLEERSNHANQ